MTALSQPSLSRRINHDLVDEDPLVTRYDGDLHLARLHRHVAIQLTREQQHRFGLHALGAERIEFLAVVHLHRVVARVVDRELFSVFRSAEHKVAFEIGLGLGAEQRGTNQWGRGIFLPGSHGICPLLSHTGTGVRLMASRQDAPASLDCNRSPRRSAPPALGLPEEKCRDLQLRFGRVFF